METLILTLEVGTHGGATVPGLEFSTVQAPAKAQLQWEINPNGKPPWVMKASGRPPWEARANGETMTVTAETGGAPSSSSSQTTKIWRSHTAALNTGEAS